MQRVNKKLQTYKPLKDVKNEIKELLMARKFKKAFSDDIKKALKDKDLDKFSAKKGGIKEDIKPMANNDTRLAQMLFKTNKGKTAYYMDEGLGYVIKVTEIKPRYLPDLAAVKDAVKDDIYEERAAKKMRADVEKAKKMTQSKSLEQT